MVEMVWGAAHEGALHLDDLLARRTRISIETAHRGVESAEPVARVVAGVLGWDEERIADEVGSYTARVEAERRSQLAADDQEADAARVAAPDIRAVALGRAPA
jgi:glycerol-3-phosphate dehydrogenase